MHTTEIRAVSCDVITSLSIVLYLFVILLARLRTDKSQLKGQEIVSPGSSYHGPRIPDQEPFWTKYSVWLTSHYSDNSRTAHWKRYHRQRKVGVYLLSTQSNTVFDVACCRLFRWFISNTNYSSHFGSSDALYSCSFNSFCTVSSPPLPRLPALSTHITTH